MPYIRRAQPDRNIGAPSIPLGVSGPAPAPAGSSSQNPLSVSPGAAQTGTGGSGAYVDFASYLNANQDQAQKLASGIMNDVGAEASAAAKPDRGSSLETQNAARAKAQTDLNTLGTPEGVQQRIADKAGPGYGSGASTMDAYLTGQAGQGGFQTLRDYYSGKLDPLSAPTSPYGTAAAPARPTPAPAAPETVDPEGKYTRSQQGVTGTGTSSSATDPEQARIDYANGKNKRTQNPQNPPPSMRGGYG